MVSVCPICLMEAGIEMPGKEVPCACVHLGVTSRNICCCGSAKGVMGITRGLAPAPVGSSVGPICIVDATGSLGPSGMCARTVQFSSAVLGEEGELHSASCLCMRHRMCAGTWNCGGELLGQERGEDRLRAGRGTLSKKPCQSLRPHLGTFRNEHLLPLGGVLQKSDTDSDTIVIS